jgi:hypothetical protein
MTSPQGKQNALACHSAKKVNKEEKLSQGECKSLSYLMDSAHWCSLSAKPSATATRYSHYCTCFGHLGRRNRYRIISICVTPPKVAKAMEQCPLKIISNCFNTNIYSYLETSGGQSYNVYLNVVHFFNTSLD